MIVSFEVAKESPVQYMLHYRMEMIVIGRKLGGSVHCIKRFRNLSRTHKKVLQASLHRRQLNKFRRTIAGIPLGPLCLLRLIYLIFSTPLFDLMISGISDVQRSRFNKPTKCSTSFLFNGREMFCAYPRVRGCSRVMWDSLPVGEHTHEIPLDIF